jgi:hypothetical protein
MVVGATPRSYARAVDHSSASNLIAAAVGNGAELSPGQMLLPSIIWRELQRAVWLIVSMP